MANIRYPYIPEGRTIEYVSENNRFMAAAKCLAQFSSLDKTMPGAAVVVKNREIIGTGANGSDYHEKHECERVRLGCKTGKGYELCEGCHPKNHSEAKAINNTLENGNQTQGADLYLWGHWWCCKWCWNRMIEVGIKRVFLIDNSEVLFNKEHPNNIVGRQFTVADD
jgi:deoxycytidylate deaminase